MKLVPRQFITPDLPRISRIEQQSFLFPWSQASLARFCQQHPHHSHIFEIDGLLTGFILVLPQPDQKLLIMQIAVAPEFRKAGVGSEMMDWLKKHYADQYKAIVLHVRPLKVEAINFYLKQGFRLTRYILDYYYPEQPSEALEMEIGLDDLN